MRRLRECFPRSSPRLRKVTTIPRVMIRTLHQTADKWSTSMAYGSSFPDWNSYDPGRVRIHLINCRPLLTETKTTQHFQGWIGKSGLERTLQLPSPQDLQGSHTSWSMDRGSCHAWKKHQTSARCTTPHHRAENISEGRLWSLWFSRRKRQPCHGEGG